MKFKRFVLLQLIIAGIIAFSGCSSVELTNTPETITTPETTPTHSEEQTTAPSISGSATTSVPLTTELPHVHEFGQWTILIEASCTALGKEQRECLCGEAEERDIAMTEHLRTIDSAISPTCLTEGKTEGSHCSVCLEVLVPQVSIDSLGHEEVCDERISPTCTKWGYTSVVSCNRCYETIEEEGYLEPFGHNYVDGKCNICNSSKADFSDIDQYRSYEGYAFFEIAKNGKNMRKLYDDMERVLYDYHTNPDIDSIYFAYNEELGDLFTVSNFSYSKYGLTLNEAQTVYTVFRKDHPIYYWMSYWLYWNDREIIITTVSEFANGEDRAKYNQIVYDGIAEYAALAEGESNAYTIALIYYEAIVNNNSYAYDDWGNADTAQWAHSIIGDFIYDEFVCEGFAKLFQLLLNFSGVENMYVVGDAYGSHVWNLVKLDDGKWYWYDLTWSCVDDGTYYYLAMNDKILQTHTPTPSNQYGMYFNITLPERAEGEFECENVLEIGEEFKIGDYTYSYSSSGTVKPLDHFDSATEKIVYKGVVYTVER